MVLDDDQKALQAIARKFARERLLPDYQKREKAKVLERALLKEMGALGLLAIDLPDAYGSLGAAASRQDSLPRSSPMGISTSAAFRSSHRWLARS